MYTEVRCVNTPLIVPLISWLPFFAHFDLCICLLCFITNAKVRNRKKKTAGQLAILFPFWVDGLFCSFMIFTWFFFSYYLPLKCQLGAPHTPYQENEAVFCFHVFQWNPPLLLCCLNASPPDEANHTNLIFWQTSVQPACSRCNIVNNVKFG